MQNDEFWDNFGVNEWDSGQQCQLRGGAWMCRILALVLRVSTREAQPDEQSLLIRHFPGSYVRQPLLNLISVGWAVDAGSDSAADGTVRPGSPPLAPVRFAPYAKGYISNLFHWPIGTLGEGGESALEHSSPGFLGLYANCQPVFEDIAAFQGRANRQLLSNICSVS